MYKYPLDVKVYKGWGLPPGSIYLSPLYYTYNFIVRGVTRNEYYTWLQEYPNPVDFEGKVLREAVLEGPETYRDKPWDWDECFAGVAEQVLEKIYRISGFGTQPDEDVTTAVEKYITSEEARFDLVIMTAYNYKLEELMAMDHRLWHMLVGSAQMKLEMMGIDTEAILYPEKAKKRKAKVALPTGKDATGMVQEGGARPFFGSKGKNPNSAYAPGHPKNPAIMEDRRHGIIPGAEGEIAFYSG